MLLPKFQRVEGAAVSGVKHSVVRFNKQISQTISVMSLSNGGFLVAHDTNFYPQMPFLTSQV